MNAVVRIIVVGLGALAIASSNGCAVGTAPSQNDEGTSAGALMGAEQAATDDVQAAAPAGNDSIHLPQRLTRPKISAPGTENAKPADPSPWLDPHGTK